MKWTFVVRQKAKAVGLLFGLMLLMVWASISMRQAFTGLDRALASVNADRLQPAVDLVYMSENVHAKRLLLEDHLLGRTPGQPAAVRARLRQHDATIRQCITEFEKTTLTESETRWLQAFRQQWTAGVAVERLMLQRMETGQSEAALRLFNQQGSTLFRQGVNALHQLAQIQADTGSKAVKAAHRVAVGGTLDATLLEAVAIVAGLVVMGLLASGKFTDHKPQRFNLN